MRSPFTRNLAFLAVITAALAGCAKKTSDRNLVFLGPAEGMKLVNNERHSLLGLGGTKNAVWVDPRSEEEYLAGHIPGAVSLPLRQINSRHEQLKEYATIIVYGGDYRDPVAEGMSKRLMRLGHNDVRTLRGGIRAWKDDGFSLETGTGED